MAFEIRGWERRIDPENGYHRWQKWWPFSYRTEWCLARRRRAKKMVFWGYVVNFGARLGFPGYVVRGVGWGGGVFRDPGPVRPLSGKFWHIKPYARTDLRSKVARREGSPELMMRLIRIWWRAKTSQNLNYSLAEIHLGLGTKCATWTLFWSPFWEK